MNKDESIINGACLLYKLLRKGGVCVSNTLMLKQRQPKTSNQTIQLSSLSFFLKCRNGIKEGTKVYLKACIAQI